MDVSSNSKPKRFMKLPAGASAEAADHSHHPRTPTSRAFVKSPVEDLYVSPILPPPPKPPQFLFVENTTPSPIESPKSPWIRQLGSNGMNYYYNSVTGDSTYRAPQGWSPPAPPPNYPPVLEETAQRYNVPVEELAKYYKPELLITSNNDRESDSHRSNLCNIPVDELAKYYKPELHKTSKSVLESDDYRTNLRNQQMFEKELHAVQNFARSKSYEAVAHEMKASMHKQEAECNTDLARTFMQRVSGMKSSEADDKDNAGRSGTWNL